MVELKSFEEIVKQGTVRKLDLQNGVISLENDSGGGWCTTLPISPPEYRKEHSIKAEFSVSEEEDKIVFIIVDDWGCEYTLTITGDERRNPIVQREVEIIKAINKEG